MFDLKFFRKLKYCIDIATAENPQLKIVTAQHSMKLKKELQLTQMTNWEDQMSYFGWDVRDMSELLDYVYDEYVPYFNLKVIDASMKLVNIADKAAYKVCS